MASVVTPLQKIHETAIIEKGAEIGKNVVIGPYAVIKHDPSSVTGAFSASVLPLAVPAGKATRPASATIS